MDEVQKADAIAPDIHIHLKPTFFQSSEYLELIQAAESNADKYPHIQTSEGYVYKRIGLRQYESQILRSGFHECG